MKREFPQLFWGLLALALALLLAAFIAAQAIQGARRAADEISVTGSAKVGIVSDQASIALTVSDTQNTAQAAYANVQRGAASLGTFLQAQGVPETELLRGGVQTEPVTYTATDEAGNRVERGAFKISRRLTVQSADIGRVQALSQNIGSLIQQGVPISADPVQYLYTKLSEVRLKLLADATKDARDRAQAIAQASGTGVGAVRSARMGVFQITPRNSVQADDYGSFDTTSREKDVTAVVGVTFAVR
jgi:uncharacterized protein